MEKYIHTLFELSTFDVVLTDQQKSNILDKIPANRMGNPQEIAYAVAFLASDEASYITGETMHVNGGMFMS